jgi:S-DNA-T family DNA segregation ATPase FtsK/SpoIIIE
VAARTGSTRGGRAPLLPPAIAAFLRNRTVEGGGVALASLGLVVAATLLTYDRADPSFNTAVSPEANHKVANVLGTPGAYAADMLLQPFGAAAYLIPALLLVWGLRIMAHRGFGRPARRVLPALGALLLGAMALGGAPAFPGWQLTHDHLGGGLGALLLDGGAALAALLGPADRAVAAMVAGGLAALLLVPAFGLSVADWVAGARGVGHAAGAAGRGARSALDRSGELAAWAGRQAGGLMRREPTLAGDGDGAGEGAGKGTGERAWKGTGPGSPAGAGPEESGRTPTLRARRASAEAAEEDAEARPVRPAPVVAPRPRPVEPGRRADAERQAELLPGAAYELPPLDLLQLPDAAHRPAALNEEGLRRNAAMLEGVLGDFGVRGEIQKVHPGPVVTLYELEPAPGTKSSRVIGLADDIARSMSAVSVRVAVVPGRNVIGIELPNARRETVYLRELLAADAYERSGAKLALVLGKDIGGGPVIADLARFPHLLVAGTTGSGKSVAVNTMILSLLYRLPPDKCRFIMIDPKMLELSVYEGIPHLLAPVVTDPKKAIVALKWTVREMEDRYRAMSKLGVRNIEGYNARLREAKKSGEVLTRRVQTGFDPDTGKPIFEDQPLDLEDLPYIVVIVDEMADLMLVAGKEIEGAIQRLAQMARAAGIHLIMATQRPSVDVITGTIKANFPTRISFQVTSKIDSRTILGEQGAEQLLGQGDMLYMAGGGRITRVHGPFVDDGEVEAVVRHLKSQGEPNYVEAITEDEDEMAVFEGEEAAGGSGDELYDKAVALVLREKKASTSFVQRHLQIGYNKAARLVERMETEGLVGPANHVGKREILVGGGGMTED